MTINYVNTGTSPNAGNGDNLRTAFNKINQNFAELSNLIETISTTPGPTGPTGPSGSGSATTEFENLTVSDTLTYHKIVSTTTNLTLGNVPLNNSSVGFGIIIGEDAASNSAGSNSVFIGRDSGKYSTASYSIAIGEAAGAGELDYQSGGNDNIAIGQYARFKASGNNNIALGASAGRAFYQGVNSATNTIAIGAATGRDYQASNSIIISAADLYDNIARADHSGFYVKPVRSSTATDYVLHYDTSTNEIVYAETANNLASINSHLLPSADLTYDLGSTSSQWRSLYVGTSTIFIGGVPLRVNTVTNTLTIGTSTNTSETNLATEAYVQQAISQGGTANLTLTVLGDAYKGFGARYGRVYGNSSPEELTVSKIVIYKDTAITDSTIASNSDNDDFEVTGLGDSDIVAMFVLYGDTNGAKTVNQLKTFARAAIDTVILNNGVEGSINSIADMRTAFYANTATLVASSGGIVPNFQFYIYNNQYQVIFDTTGQGTGSGFSVNQLSYNLQTGQPELSGWGNGGGYTQGDQIVIPGTSINYEGTPLLSPDNDVTITITQVNPSGFITNTSVSGTLPPPPPLWPENQISDGGSDQYDNGNYINTNLAQEISYNSGIVVADASSAFGTGSSYVSLYSNGIFGFIATGSSAARISTSGGSGADGSSSTDTGELLVTDKTYDPALTDLTLTNDPLRATPLNFVKRDGQFEDIDIIVEDDGQGGGVGITRGEDGGIYNPYTEEGWNSSVSPQGTLWSVGDTEDLLDIERRSYTNFYAAYGSGQLGNRVPGSKAIMYVPSTDKYYLIEWLTWTQGGNYGGFSYKRTEIDASQVSQGIRFADGTRLTSAEGLGRVKSTATGNRRIEEVTGYKEVSLTARNTVVLTTTASRSVTDSNAVWVDVTTTTIDDVINDYNLYEVDTDVPRQFSLDNVTWYEFNGGYSTTGNERGYGINTPLTYNQGDTIYFRYTGGGSPKTWWNKNELPSGGTGFRGAVIDFHAYTGEATWIGTIHIVDDDGDNNITHSEVSSGSTDSENDDLWVVSEEGQIRYRRIDGESKILKIHWTAKVFYGSETYD